MIPYGRQCISQEDINSVVEVLGSDWLTQGPRVPEFESSLVSLVGAKHALVMNSATSALHLACLALDLGPGDWLWTSPNSFVASANCGVYCGAGVDFVDIDPITLNMSVDALKDKLETAERAGRLPKIVIPVHFAGHSCEMDKIHAMSRKYGFKIIEDASHAVGGRYKDKYVGSCQYSDICVFSFHPVKILTSAEGGAAITNNDELFERMALYRSHGVEKRREKLMHLDPEPWFYEQTTLGYNYRMSDLHAALGNSQLKRIESFINKRIEIAKIYDEELSELPLILPAYKQDTVSSFHLYVVQLDPKYKKLSRTSLFNKLREKGIGVNVHYIPIYRQPFYQSLLGDCSGQFANTEKYYGRAITIPIFYSLTSEEIDCVINALKTLLR